MKLTHQQYELIEAYLCGELSATDQRAFEAELTIDSELSSEVETLRELRFGLHALAIDKQLSLARQQWKQANQSVQPPLPSFLSPPVNRITNVRSWGGNWQLAAAASIVFVVGILLFIYRQSETISTTEIAYNEAFQQGDALFQAKDLPKSVPATDIEDLLGIVNQYKAGEFGAVIQKLKTMSTEKRTTPYKNYFLGLSLLSNKQPEKAIPYLNKAFLTSTGVLAQKSEWFLALAYLKMGDKSEATRRLNLVAQKPNHPFQSFAKQVMEKL